MRLNLKISPNVNINIPTVVPSFNTIFAGFCIGQLATSGLTNGNRIIIFGNCAPRKDRGKDARERNEGEHLVYAVLDNKIELLVVNSGHSLSFIKDHIKELWAVNVDEGGTQFRSRDRYPRVVQLLSESKFDEFKADRMDPNIIPEMPKGVVGYIDSFHNIKTTWRANDEWVKELAPGQAVNVTINERVHQARVATGSFNIKEGELAFAPGSSGGENRYMEVFLRGGKAADTFGILEHPADELAHELSSGLTVKIDPI